MLVLRDQSELLRMKRDAALRAREEHYEQRRAEEFEKKRQHLAVLKAEFEETQKKNSEARLQHVRKQADLRFQKKAENRRLNERRDVQIQKREKAWLAKANKEIQQIVAAHIAEEERLERAVQDARTRKHSKAKAIADAKVQVKAHWEELEMRRTEAEDLRMQSRELKGLQRVEELKADAYEELMNFIHHPQPVPLKQTLAGRTRGVPNVTELLAAYKDAREELKDLEDQDIPMRATLRNMSLFAYVREVQQKAEAERLRPPEPVAADANRGMRSGSRRNAPGSPAKSPTRRMVASPSRRQK